MCGVHQRGALHHCPMSLPPVPRSPAESREELMERAALHGQVGIRHTGLAPQDTARMESCSCWQPCVVVKEMVAPWVAMAWGMLWWGAGGSAQSAPQNGVLGCSQHPGTALWGEHLSPPLEGCCLLCIWAAHARSSKGVGYIQEEGGSRLSWLIVSPQGTSAQSFSTTVPAPRQSWGCLRAPSGGRGYLQQRYVFTYLVFCSCISKVCGEKKKRVPGTLHGKYSGCWWCVPSIAGGCPGHGSPPRPWHAPQATVADVPSSAGSRTCFIASVADGEGQFWLFTRQLDDGSLLTCQHQYNPPAKPALAGWLLGLTEYFPLRSTVSAVRQDKKNIRDVMPVLICLLHAEC